MNLAPLDIAVILVYLLGIGAIGIYQARKIRGSGDYFAGGRSFNKFLMMMHALGTGTHADDPVVVAGASFERGLAGIWYTFIYLFVTPFYWLIAPVYRRTRFLTTSDFFEARFGSSLALLYAVMGVLTFTLNTGTLLKGTGMLAHAISQGAIPQWAAIAGMTVVFVAYGTAGGLLATVVTESIQGLLVVLMSLLLVPFGLIKVGGFVGLHHLVASSKFDFAAPSEMTIPWIVAASVTALIGIVAQPQTMEGCSTGKTEWEGRVGTTYGTMIKRFCALGWTMTGLIVFAMVAAGAIPGLAHREEAFGTAIRTLLPVGFMGLMFAAILAAQMGALSAFMVNASALLSRNVYKRWLRPSATDHNVVSFARYAGLGVVGLGALVAFIVPGVADALTYFWAIASFTGLFVWAGVLWRKTNATGAWASFVLMVSIWLLLGPIGIHLHKLFPGIHALGMYGDKLKLHLLILSYLPAGAVALVAGSLLGKPRDRKKLDDFYMLLKTPVGEEQKLVDAGVDMVYAGRSEGHPWEMKHHTLVNVVGFIVALAISVSFLGILWLLGRIGS